MNMDWLNLPIVELAFAIGGIIGIAIGYWAGYSVENIASYHKGYKSAKLENDGLRKTLGDLWRLFLKHAALAPCDLPEVDAVRESMCELGVLAKNSTGNQDYVSS